MLGRPHRKTDQSACSCAFWIVLPFFAVAHPPANTELYRISEPAALKDACRQRAATRALGVASGCLSGLKSCHRCIGVGYGRLLRTHGFGASLRSCALSSADI